MRERSPRTIPAATTFLQTHLSTHRPLFRFFAKKTEPKMPPLCSATRKQASAYALPGFKRRLYFRCAEVVGALPGFRCPTTRAAVCDFLPLHLFDEMRICDGRSFTSRTGAIGHREYNPTFILHPFRWFYLPTNVGETLVVSRKQTPPHLHGCG